MWKNLFCPLKKRNVGDAIASLYINGGGVELASMKGGIDGVSETSKS